MPGEGQPWIVGDHPGTVGTPRPEDAQPRLAGCRLLGERGREELGGGGSVAELPVDPAARADAAAAAGVAKLRRVNRYRTRPAAYQGDRDHCAGARVDVAAVEIAGDRLGLARRLVERFALPVAQDHAHVA